MKYCANSRTRIVLSCVPFRCQYIGPRYPFVLLKVFHFFMHVTYPWHIWHLSSHCWRYYECLPQISVVWSTFAINIVRCDNPCCQCKRLYYWNILSRRFSTVWCIGFILASARQSTERRWAKGRLQGLDRNCTSVWTRSISSSVRCILPDGR